MSLKGIRLLSTVKYYSLKIIIICMNINLGIFLFTTASRRGLRPTQPPIQWIPGSLSLNVKWSGREADHSPPPSAEVKE